MKRTAVGEQSLEGDDDASRLLSPPSVSPDPSDMPEEEDESAPFASPDDGTRLPGGGTWVVLVGGAFCNMLNGTLGPAVLVLPLAMSRVGARTGVVLLFFFWFFSHLGLRRMLDTCARPRASTLGLAAETHGPRISALVDISVVLYFYGTCVSYLILMHGTIRHLFHGAGHVHGGHDGHMQTTGKVLVAESEGGGGEVPDAMPTPLSKRSVTRSAVETNLRNAHVRPPGENAGVWPTWSSGGGSSEGQTAQPVASPSNARKARGSSGIARSLQELHIGAGSTREVSSRYHVGKPVPRRHDEAPAAAYWGVNGAGVEASPNSIGGPMHAQPGSAHRLIHVHPSTIVLVAVTMCVLAPLSSSRSLRALERVSSLVVVAYIYIALALAFGDGSNEGAATHLGGAEFISSATDKEGSFSDALLNCLRAMPLMAYVFSSQPVYPPLVSVIHEQVPGQAGRRLSWMLVHATFVTTFAFYCGVALLGLARAPAKPPPNVLWALPNTPAFSLANAALVLSVGLSFPVMLIVARSHLYHLMPSRLPSEESGGLRVLSFSLVAGALTTAIVFPRVEACLGLIGATCSVSLSFFVPAWMQWDDMVAHRSKWRARTKSAAGEGGDEVRRCSIDSAEVDVSPPHHFLVRSILKRSSVSFEEPAGESQSNAGTWFSLSTCNRYFELSDVFSLLVFGALVAVITIPMQIGTLLGAL